MNQHGWLMDVRIGDPGREEATVSMIVSHESILLLYLTERPGRRARALRHNTKEILWDGTVGAIMNLGQAGPVASAENPTSGGPGQDRLADRQEIHAALELSDAEALALNPRNLSIPLSEVRSAKHSVGLRCYKLSVTLLTGESVKIYYPSNAQNRRFVLAMFRDALGDRFQA